jgi:hypothetical protein
VASNRRLYYAIQAVGLAPLGVTTYTAVHGLQSVGINTKFNLEQVFEIGQLSIYQNVENVPDIEATMEKCLDGYPLLYHLATQGAPDASLVGRSNQRTSVALSVFGDTQQAASGTPLQQTVCSGMYLSAVTYDLKVEGTSTESVTLVGNNKTIQTSAFTFSGGFTDADAPLASQGVSRRQHLVMANCRWPKGIPGINGTGVNVLQADGSYTVHLQSVRVTANLGRDQLLELGHKAPYFRYVNFPVEIRTDIEVLDSVADGIQALEEADNLVNEHIYVEVLEGTKIDLGSENKLSTVNYGGANAGARGGNAHSTFSYITFNDLTVVHPQDPTVALRG